MQDFFYYVPYRWDYDARKWRLFSLKDKRDEFPRVGPPIATVSNLDIDTEYQYSMSKAMKSYRTYREKDKTDARRRAVSAGYMRKYHPLCRKLASSRRPVHSAPPRGKVLLPTPPPDHPLEAVGYANNTLARSKRRPQVNRVVVRMDNIMHPDQPPAAMTQSLHNDFSRFADNVDSSMAMSTSYNSALRSSASTPTYTGTREQHNHYDSPFFRGVGSPRKKAYTIHPEWASEALSVKKLSLNDRGRDSTDSGKGTGSSPKKKVKERNERRHYRFENKYATVPPRRCKSAPPCFSRNRLNPITWQQWYGPNNR